MFQSAGRFFFKRIFYCPRFGQYIGRLVLISTVILARYENDCETRLISGIILSLGIILDATKTAY